MHFFLADFFPEIFQKKKKKKIKKKKKKKKKILKIMRIPITQGEVG